MKRWLGPPERISTPFETDEEECSFPVRRLLAYFDFACRCKPKTTFGDSLAPGPAGISAPTGDRTAGPWAL
jgi:hypothetical protein